MAELIPRLVESLRAQSPPLGLLLPAGVIAYLASHGIYNILFHPLRAYPGPFLFRLTGITKTYYSIRGNLQFLVKDLHDIYGPVVRLGPSELSFAEPAAFKDIYGHRLTASTADGRKQAAEFPKLDDQVRLSLKQPNNILNAPSHEEHAFLRKKLAPGFSDRSMRAQEPIINGYVDLLIKQLRARAQDHGATTAPAPVDMMDWFSWTTFDIIGNLGFGSDFGSLESGKGHPWVISLSQGIVATAKLVALKSFGFGKLLGWLMDSDLVQDFVESRKYVQAKVRERLELKNERPDFLQGFIEGDNSLPFDHITSNAAIIILAGSESTSTALTGTLYLLLTNPDKLARVTREIRSTFSSEQDISLSSVQQQLPYLLACLDEALRCYPPVTTGMARVIPDDGGAVVCGRHVPKDTAVAVWQWVVNHDEKLWHDPYGFHPERFLGRNKASSAEEKEEVEGEEAEAEDTAQFANDNLEALMPFHTGPRNCIGKSLAYAEMRLIISRLLYAFDMSLADDKKEWISSQRAYFVWDKQPLMVNLRLAQ